MPLHPQVIQFLETQRSLERKPIAQCTPDEFRKVMRLVTAANGEPEPIDAVTDPDRNFDFWQSTQEEPLIPV